MNIRILSSTHPSSTALGNPSNTTNTSTTKTSRHHPSSPLSPVARPLNLLQMTQNPTISVQSLLNSPQSTYPARRLPGHDPGEREDEVAVEGDAVWERTVPTITHPISATQTPPLVVPGDNTSFNITEVVSNGETVTHSRTAGLVSTLSSPFPTAMVSADFAFLERRFDTARFNAGASALSPPLGIHCCGLCGAIFCKCQQFILYLGSHEPPELSIQGPPPPAAVNTIAMLHNNFSAEECTPEGSK